LKSRREKTSSSFLKKRTKKLLLTVSLGDDGAKARKDKVFLLLFVHRKKSLLASRVIDQTNKIS
jgi:hypothetical protein